MKINRPQNILFSTMITLSVLVPLGHTAGYRVDWQTIDGGGGDCRAGKLSLSGGVGQPDAGLSTGSTYVHQGGFLPAFLKDVGPPLSIVRSTGNYILSWPDICTGFVLEGARDVTGPWTALGTGTVSADNYRVTLTSPTLYRFFRLKKDCPQ